MNSNLKAILLVFGFLASFTIVPIILIFFFNYLLIAVILISFALSLGILIVFTFFEIRNELEYKKNFEDNITHGFDAEKKRFYKFFRKELG
jgi:c-di-AMP phosphodiesterase-like protein